MKKKNTNRLTKLIFGELICLAVVCLAVFALVRWSARAEGNSADGRQLTMAPVPTGAISAYGQDRENDEENASNAGMPSPTAAEAGKDAVTQPGESGASDPSDEGDVPQGTGNAGQKPGDASQPSPTDAPQSTDAPKPTATTAPKPTSTPKPTATTAPKPTMSLIHS